jgi:hypothetical protein
METRGFEWNQDAVDAARLDAARSHILYSQSRVTFIYPLISALALCTLLWEISSSATLLAWLALVVTLTLVRFYMLRTFQMEQEDCAHQDWLNVFAVSALLSGLLWGSAPMIIIPRAPERLVEFPLWNGLVVLVICGLVAGATVAYAASLRVLFCYLIPALLLPAVYLISLGDRYNTATGGFLLLFLAHASTTAVRMHMQLQHYFEMEYQLERLRSDLREPPPVIFSDTTAPMRARRLPPVGL